MVSNISRVLLVEDNPAHAKLMLRTLREFGESLAIDHVSDGEAALAYLYQTGQFAHKKKLPHLVLLDLRIPKFDGLTVLSRLKQDPNLKQIPVVILTTSDADADVRGATDRFANSYLVKPIEYLQFVKLMRSVGAYWTELNHMPSS
ncbi:two-component system response regulator [Blastopirellula marina]|uniref:Two-component system response regulator n=1 Tax=Blastopirellula marina TaxID=124 RepID=A0A2S8FUA3_9BACT|nr:MULTISPECIES: response regulator [Pirellulaceae]PQO35759.1 two-component system response regulator [Blastopirellula marina]RCS53333.1 response regulator [Bremerella cremea]